MTYKKIEITPTGEISGKGGTKTFRAIKKAYSVLKKDFSTGTNNMAELWVKNGSQKKAQRVKKLKDESMAMAKNISSDLRKTFKEISPKVVICDISYELGGVLKKTKDVFNDYIDEITRIPNGK